MNYLIRNLEREQLHEIYHMWIHRHFPQNEIKPLKNIDKMWDMGCYRAMGMYKEGDARQGVNEGSAADRVIGYAFFAMAPECDMLLLDYFAVVEEYRSQGVGGIFLKEMRKMLDRYRGILIETENVEYAQNEEELKVRQKRDTFYEKNGVLRTQIRSRIYGVDFAIWSLPVQGELPAEEAGTICSRNQMEGRNIPDDAHCKKQIEQIYKVMVPGEKYEKYVNIYKKEQNL